MTNPLQLAGYDRKTARSFLVVGTASQVIYSVDAIREVLYEPYIEYMGINNTELGILFTISSTSYLLFILFGWIHSIFQAKTLFLLGLLSNFLIGIIIFLRPGMGFRALVPLFIWYSLKEVAFWPAALNYVRSFSSPKKQGLTFSLHEFLRRIAAIGLSVSAILCFALSRGQLWGIRLAIFIDAVCIGTFIVITFLRVPSIEVDPRSSKSGFSSYVLLLRNPEIWLVGICGMAITANYYILLIIVPFLRGGFGLSSSAAGFIALGASAFVGSVSCLFGGVLADKLFKSPSRMIKYLLYALFFTVIFLLALPKAPEYLASSITAICLSSAIVYMLRGLSFAPIAEIGIPQELNGAAVSIASFIGFSPGLWMHMFNGSLLDTFKHDVLKAYGIMFSVCLVITFGAIICAHRLSRRIKLKRARGTETSPAC